MLDPGRLDDRVDHPERGLVAVPLAIVGLLVPDHLREGPPFEGDAARVVLVRLERAEARVSADRGLDPPRVFLGEALVDPALREEGVVEPGMRGLVHGRQRIEVLAELDPFAEGEEHAGVALERGREALAGPRGRG